MPREETSGEGPLYHLGVVYGFVGKGFMGDTFAVHWLSFRSGVLFRLKIHTPG